MKKTFQISMRIASVIVLILTVISCDKEYEDITSDKDFQGVFVLNQAGSISYFNDKNNELTADIYNAVNGVDAGSSLTAFSMYGEKVFLLKGSNSAQKIEVLNSKTLKSEGVQGDFANLTDLAAVSEAFVVVTQGVSGSELSGSLTFLDSKDLTKNLGTLKVGKNPTRLAYGRGKKMYVANTGDAAYPDSTVMVIDVTLKAVTDTIVLQQTNSVGNVLKLSTPIDIALDSYQNIWVLCAGKGTQEAGLAKISYGTHEVSVFPFENGYQGSGRGGLSTSYLGGAVYFVNDALYTMQFDDTSLPTKKFFTGTDYEDMIFNVVGFNPFNGKIVCAIDGIDDEPDFIYVFDRYNALSSKSAIGKDKMPRQFIFVSK